MLYGILQSVFNVSYAQRLFREDDWPHGFRNGIAMYVKIIKTIGLNTQTRIWNSERYLQRVYNPSTPNGLELYIQQYKTTFANLEYLGKHISQRTKMDTLLKNMLTAENTSQLRQIFTDAQREEKLFDYACEKLMDQTDIFKWTNECNLWTLSTQNSLRLQQFGTCQEGCTHQPSP
jgi:hypothetical protein